MGRNQRMPARMSACKLRAPSKKLHRMITQQVLMQKNGDEELQQGERPVAVADWMPTSWFSHSRQVNVQGEGTLI